MKKNGFSATSIFLSLLCLEGCATFPAPQFEVHPFSGNPNEPKNIFVFLDGTSNDGRTEERKATNVWRLFDKVTDTSNAKKDPQLAAIYIAGVGTVDSPVFGLVLGRGMEERILRGYRFVAENYSLRDRIYVVGFSRGALEARALAGLIAYVGVAAAPDAERSGDQILDALKDYADASQMPRWKAWSASSDPPLAREIGEPLGAKMKPAEIQYLGIWDTVPGSAFKKYEGCKEKIGFWKRWFNWLPLISKGERYKIDTYPPIRFIAHAVSTDEKRSKFAPVLACPPIGSASNSTAVEEVWFPGAHADVGGGYEDDEGLAGITLAWMIASLSKSYPSFDVSENIRNVKQDFQGVAHWSIHFHPANAGSHCHDRDVPAEKRDQSFLDRAAKGTASLMIQRNQRDDNSKYPLKCSDVP
jgi:uncharacterized protein (DUF2235 family)